MKTNLKKIITVVGLCSSWLVASSIASDIPDTNLSVGTEFTYWVKANIDKGDKVRFKLLKPRKGMRIHAKSGRLTWTPTSNQVSKGFDTTVKLMVNGEEEDRQTLHFVVKEKPSSSEKNGIFVELTQDAKFRGDGTASNPFSHLKTACMEATAKDKHRIYVRGGYYRNLKTSSNISECVGTKKSPIVIEPWGNEQVTIAFNDRAGISIRSSEHTVVQGFEVVGVNQKVGYEDAIANWWKDTGKYQGTGIFISQSAKYITVQKNIVHDTSASGIKAVKATSVKIKNNIVYNCAWWTIQGTTGIGITLAIGEKSDKPKVAYNQMVGNLIFNNESRIYSRVWKKGEAFLRVDEGEAILVQEENVGEKSTYKGRYLIKNNIILYNGKTAVVNKASHVDIVKNSFYMNGTTAKDKEGYYASGIRINNSKDVTFKSNAIDSDEEYGLLYSVAENSKNVFGEDGLEKNMGRGAYTLHAHNTELPTGLERTYDDIFENPKEGNFTIREGVSSYDIGANPNYDVPLF